FHEGYDQLDTGINDSRKIPRDPIEEVDNDVCGLIDHSTDVVRNTSKETNENLHSSIGQHRYSLDQSGKHLSQHDHESVNNLRRECLDSIEKRCKNNDNSLRDGWPSCRNNLCESNQTKTNLLHDQ